MNRNLALGLGIGAVLVSVAWPADASLTCTGFYPEGDSVAIVASLDKGRLVLPVGPYVAYDIAEILGSEVARIECTAEGSELAYVAGRFNVPVVNGASRVRWYGDTARFILGNASLPQAH
jgi:hypothetical protein